MKLSKTCAEGAAKSPYPSFEANVSVRAFLLLATGVARHEPPDRGTVVLLVCAPGVASLCRRSKVAHKSSPL